VKFNPNGLLTLHHIYQSFITRNSENYDDEDFKESTYEGTYKIRSETAEEILIKMHLTNFSQHTHIFMGMNETKIQNQTCDFYFYIVEDNFNKKIYPLLNSVLVSDEFYPVMRFNKKLQMIKDKTQTSEYESFKTFRDCNYDAETI